MPSCDAQTAPTTSTPSRHSNTVDAEVTMVLVRSAPAATRTVGSVLIDTSKPFSGSEPAMFTATINVPPEEANRTGAPGQPTVPDGWRHTVPVAALAT